MFFRSAVSRYQLHVLETVSCASPFRQHDQEFLAKPKQTADVVATLIAPHAHQWIAAVFDDRSDPADPFAPSKVWSATVFGRSFGNAMPESGILAVEDWITATTDPFAVKARLRCDKVVVESLINGVDECSPIPAMLGELDQLGKPNGVGHHSPPAACHRSRLNFDSRSQVVWPNRRPARRSMRWINCCLAVLVVNPRA